jgi:hypothetical protein
MAGLAGFEPASWRIEGDVVPSAFAADPAYGIRVCLCSRPRYWMRLEAGPWRRVSYARGDIWKMYSCKAFATVFLRRPAEGTSSRRDGTFYRCSPCRIPFGLRLSADAVSGSRSDERDETCQLRADPAGVEPASWLDQCSSICIRYGPGLRHPLILGRGDKGSRDNPLSRPGAWLFPARPPAPDVVPRAFPPAVAASRRCPVRARSFRSRLPNAKPRAFRLRTPRPSRTPRRRSPQR